MSRARSFLVFVGLAYAWSWLCWIPVVVALSGRPGVGRDGTDRLAGIPAWATAGALIGGYGPSLAALGLTTLAEGREGVRRLLARLKVWRVGARWHLVALLAPSLFLGVAIVLYAFFEGGLPPPTLDRMARMPLALLAAIPFGPLGEELGWRGYLLPRLQEKQSALASSVIIGVLWTFWHLPLFWAPAGTTLSGGPVSVAAVLRYLVSTVALSVVFTWLFDNTRGSVLLAVVLHATWNAALPIYLFPRLPVALVRHLIELAVLPLCATAVWILVRYGPARFHRNG